MSDPLSVRNNWLEQDRGRLVDELFWQTLADGTPYDSYQHKHKYANPTFRIAISWAFHGPELDTHQRVVR